MNFQIGTIQFEGQVNLNPSFILYNHVRNILERQLKIHSLYSTQAEEIIDVKLGYDLELDNEDLNNSKISQLWYTVKLKDGDEVTGCGRVSEQISQMDFMAGMLCLCTFSSLPVINRNAILNYKEPKLFEVAIDNSTIKTLDLNEVVFFEANGTYTNIQLNTGEKIICSVNLGVFEEFTQQFPDIRRVNRSYIANFDYFESRERGEKAEITLKSQIMVYNQKVNKIEKLDIVEKVIKVQDAYKKDFLEYIRSSRHNATQGK